MQVWLASKSGLAPPQLAQLVAVWLKHVWQSEWHATQVSDVNSSVVPAAQPVEAVQKFELGSGLVPPGQVMHSKAEGPLQVRHLG